MDYMGIGIIVEKDHFLCEQAREFPVDGFLNVLQSGNLHLELSMVQEV
jgi:hypothetical protein